MMRVILFSRLKQKALLQILEKGFLLDEAKLFQAAKPTIYRGDDTSALILLTPALADRHIGWGVRLITPRPDMVLISIVRVLLFTPIRWRLLQSRQDLH